MNRYLFAIAIVMVIFISDCKTPTFAERKQVSRHAVSALQDGNFSKAINEADQVLRKDRGNCYASLVRGIAEYMQSAMNLNVDVRRIWTSGSRYRGFDLESLRTALERAEKEFGTSGSDLAKACNCGDISLDLNPARWERDWNQNGRIDSWDRALLEVELDSIGRPIPEGDPRRRPTYRFDLGDVYWARAHVSFQRALLNIPIAFDWSVLNSMIMRGFRPDMVIRIKLLSRGRIHRAHRQILDGLYLADTARQAFLAETDDDREWVPRPGQKKHPMPLEVTEKLYENWKLILEDLRRLFHGKEGLQLADVARLVHLHADQLPKGCLDIGRMFTHPKDIAIDMRQVMQLLRPHDIENLLKSIFGEYYRYGMKPSPLTARLFRMRSEIDRGLDTFGRKLRYLLWLN